MNRTHLKTWLAAAALALAPASALADGPLHVVTTIPDYADFAARLGGSRVSVEHIVRGDQDAHFIRPKPSFATMVQHADVLVATGLDLELWLPTVVDRSGNTSVRSGMAGYVAASQGMPLLEKPTTMSRVEGGVHVFGNPHVTTSPLMMRFALENIAIGLTKNDPAGAETYAANLERTLRELDERMYGAELLDLLGSETLTRLGLSGRLVPFLRSNSYQDRPLTDYAGGWLARMLPLYGKPIVTYHKNWVYFVTLFGLEEAGTIEPKPGIPPSPRHVADVTNLMRERGLKIILAANYFDEHKVRTVAESVGAAPVIVPLYVGGAPGADDYFSLVDLWVDSIVRAAEEMGLIAARSASAR
jgi:ABC-type Zn uptake system ZnuABC Zn-binding protein ZnuA